jgi:monofunctional glycosyltransferase
VKILLRWMLRGLLIALMAFVTVQAWYFAHILYWIENNPHSTAFMRARLESLREDDPGARLAHRWVPYERISVHLKRAVIASEDTKFMHHRGFDWEAIRHAFERNVREGGIVLGGSTITQQLAKNLFLSPDRAWWRKAQEAAIAAMVETVLSKRRILEIYLNVIEWGDGVYGAEAAARHHFGVSAAQLTPQQSARLAAIVPSPRRYAPGEHSGYLARRTATILARMNAVEIP